MASFSNIASESTTAEAPHSMYFLIESVDKHEKLK